MFGILKKNTPAQAQGPALRADQLQPRIKHLNFLKALQAAGVPPAQQPSHMPLCGELIVTYAFDLPDSFMMATPNLVELAGVDPRPDLGRLVERVADDERLHLLRQPRHEAVVDAIGDDQPRRGRAALAGGV